MADEKSEAGHWSLDKRVPIATLFALIGQTGGMVWWASSLQSTVSQHSQTLEDFRVNGTPVIRAEIAGLKERSSSFDQRLERIENGIDRLDRKLDAALERRK